MENNLEAYDSAMFAFSQGDYDAAIDQLTRLVELDSADFDAQLSLGMAYYRKGDFARAILEGHKAEKLRPNEQLVHTNLSLFYMKSGDKKTAEHHGLQARIASWRDNMAPPGAATSPSEVEKELQIAKPAAPAMKLPDKFPDMPWKKKSNAPVVVAPTAAGSATTVPPARGPASEFICAGSASSLAPGSGRTFVVSGREIAIYNVEGRYFALDDSCSHRGASLGAGYQENGNLYCPLHGWKFDLATGACESNPERPVLTHDVEVRDDGLWVRLNPLRTAKPNL